MLTVKTKVKLSSIPGAGMGLFADEDIKKGTTIWTFMPGLDLTVPEEKLLQLSEPARGRFLHYAYVDKVSKQFILCFDDNRFINHSENPNVVEGKSDSQITRPDIAARDIKKGEELLCNYYDFDLDADRKLNKKGVYTHLIEDTDLRNKKLSEFIDNLLKK